MIEESYYYYFDVKKDDSYTGRGRMSSGGVGGTL